MSTYSQLSLEERCSIARLREAGQSIRQIAAALDRQPSTIAREVKRNSGAQVGYRPSYAQQQAEARRWTGARLDRDDSLREAILDRLAEGWSPEQIAGRLAREAGHKVISHETIYRFVYAQLKRTNDRRWRHYLPRAKYKRGWRTKGGWPRQTGRVSIHDRPLGIATRQQAGHWEADAMLFSTAGQAILVAHERRSRLTIAVRQNSLKADPVATALTRMLRPMPADLRQSITFDNGTEFTRHQRIARQLGVQTFFCDPRAPWQKGYSEINRSVKYGFLFIGFTFLMFWLFDVVGGVAVATVEYLLAGAGLVLFFVMLLAFAEVIGFTLAYGVAAGAIVGLLGAYSAAVLGSARRAGLVAALLAALYGVLYVLLGLEAYSLLIGSLLLFAGLAAVMWLTRAIDWQAKAG